METLENPRCPECGSSKIVKDGIRYLNDGSQVQRWLCGTCFYRFIPEDHKRQRTHYNGRECAERKDPKNSLSQVSSMTEIVEQTSGENLHKETKGKILSFAWHMQKQGLSPNTIETFTNSLKRLEKSGADLLDPESVKETLFRLTISQNSKATTKDAYSGFLRFLGIPWIPPRIPHQTKIPFIPLESEIDTLIAGCGKTTSLILQLLKESGMRIGEALRLKWIDMNTENNTIILNEPEKHCEPRIFRVSPKLIGMLQSYPKKAETIFGSVRERHRQHTFKLQRIRLAQKLGNPRLKQIHFHTLRHWKATMEYHKTHDVYHVKMLLGHKSLTSTEIYINIEQAIFNDANDEFHVKIASNLKEACRLLEVGFEYVTDMEGKKLFRKRK